MSILSVNEKKILNDDGKIFSFDMGVPRTTIGFAIYSEDDNSLSFYGTYSTIPSIGDTFKGKSVTEIYTGFETEIWSTSDSVFWDSIRDLIKKVVIDSSFKTVQPISLGYWFNRMGDCAKIEGLQFLNTENVIYMRYMFNRCVSLTELDVSGFNTENVTDMRYMFNRCVSLTELDVSGFNTENVTDMRYMFGECSSLIKLDVSRFDTSKVTRMSGIFESCSSLTELDVSGFNTENVTDMDYMFDFCTSLTELDVSGFNTTNVEAMDDAFGYCSSLTEIDVSGFNTAKVEYMGFMFYGCSSLKTIYSNDTNFVTSAVRSGNSMFTGCTKLVGGNGTAYSSDNVTYAMAHIDTVSNPGYFTEK